MVLTDDELIDMAGYMIEKRATVRQTAGVYGVSKSGVHSAVTRRLGLIDIGLAAQVRKLLDENLKARARRGGEALRKKLRGGLQP